MRFPLPLWISALLLFACARAWAAGPGTSAAPFLDLDFGARVSGMGQAVVSMADEVSTIYYNPAGLAYSSPSTYQPRTYEAVLAQALYIQDVRVTQFGFMRRPWALHLTQVGVPGLEQRTGETAAPDGTFGASDLALSVSRGARLGSLGVGATGRMVRETIGAQAATAYALDLGFLRRLENRPWSFGLGVMNVGTKVRFVEQSYPLPMTIRAGATYGMTRSFPHALNAQVDLPRDSNPVLRLSFEYAGFGPFALRAGYRTESGPQREAALGKALGTTASGLSEFYGMFMGVGFKSKLGTLDYSITPYGELGSAHRFSIGMRFGGAQPKLLGTAVR